MGRTLVTSQSGCFSLYKLSAQSKFFGLEIKVRVTEGLKNLQIKKQKGCKICQNYNLIINYIGVEKIILSGKFEISLTVWHRLQVFMLEQNCHPHSTVQRLFIFILILALKITFLQCYCLYLVLLNEYLKRFGLTSPKRTRDLSLTNEGVQKINPKSWAIKRKKWLHFTRGRSACLYRIHHFHWK